PEIRRIYGLYHREEDVSNRHIDAAHNYNVASRNAAYEFFNRVLKRENRRLAAAPVETEVLSFDPAELLIGQTTNRLPQYRELLASWRAAAKERVTSLSAEKQRELLQSVLHVNWHETVETAIEGDFLFLSRAGYRESVPARYLPGVDSADAVVVHS